MYGLKDKRLYRIGIMVHGMGTTLLMIQVQLHITHIKKMVRIW